MAVHFKTALMKSFNVLYVLVSSFIKLLFAAVIPYLLFGAFLYFSLNYLGKFLGDSLLYNLFFKD